MTWLAVGAVMFTVGATVSGTPTVKVRVAAAPTFPALSVAVTVSV